MKNIYTVIKEEESSLFDRRIKLAELTILTITALMVILSFTQKMDLILPIGLLSLNLIFIIVIIIWGANKSIKETDFSNNIDVIKKDISYILYKKDIASFVVYAFSILLMLYILK